MSALVTDIGWASFAKYGEELCGDQVAVLDRHGTSPVMVLADGLGSGVKACILATLTTKIIGTMVRESMPLEECVATVISTLPVCDERKIAYATFTIIRVTECREAEVVQYDNPGVILLRNGTHQNFPTVETTLAGKTILTSRIPIQEGDTLVAVSDGALHAGTGETLNYSWNRDAVIRYLEETHASRLAAKSICTVLRDQCRTLYGGRPGDDTTACAVAVRKRSEVNVLIGPALNAGDDATMMEHFFALPGKHAVCGGTTAQIAAAYLGRAIKKVAAPASDMPPVSHIDGVALVTEGMVTLGRASAYAKDYSDENRMYDEWCFAEDGASLLARLLLDEATHVTFFVGRADNPAYANASLPLGVTAKLRMVSELLSFLEKAGKIVTVSYW